MQAHRRITRRLTVLLAVGSLAALLLVAAPAGAATSAQEGYSGTGPRIEQRLDPKTKVQQVSDGSLPFTGLDVFAIVAVGAALLAVGLGVRRLSATAATVR
jgi:hypothetical protein